MALREGAQTIAAYVHDYDVNLVHANSLSSAICAARGLNGGTPIVWHVRDLRLPRAAVRWLTPRTAAIVAISQAVAAHLADLDPPAAAKVRVVHNGVDTEAFSPHDSRAKLLAELGLPAESLLMGGVGQLVPWKNWPTFLRVGADVAARVPNLQVLVIGADLFHDHPRYREELEELASDLAIGRQVRFLGHRKDIVDVLSALDVFVHCAEQEPLGRAIMEAMALARPVVAVGAGGPAELVVDGESGLLAPPRNTYAIADRVVHVLKDPALAHLLGQAARARIETHFHPGQTARLVEQVYADVLWQAGATGAQGMDA
jgi:glycosyltransferase involved in cell wall biosynthesis